MKVKSPRIEFNLRVTLMAGLLICRTVPRQGVFQADVPINARLQGSGGQLKRGNMQSRRVVLCAAECLELACTQEGDEEIRVSNTQTDERIAYGFLRFVFGLNICFHGLSRLLGDHQAFLAYLNKSLAPAVLVPKAAVPVFAAVLPWVEALVGLLLLLGLFTRIALMAGFLVMILLMGGVTLAQDWETAGLQLIYCLVYFILLTFLGRNYFSLDSLLQRSAANGSA